ncbi:hypothetical protein [Anoxybacillus flavithermus]|uniref:Uncharacterized protein n=1 Tax=Anoxybacillus flavithermus AK1 TaxID=1297581 RepID=M8D6F6_9BACL|nr:hypothetical protein [Anoxybacillus flavithermus]EMT46442.1 hypothetical protein H919_04254 [Anoxybacillus flavithermus AK1]
MEKCTKCNRQGIELLEIGDLRINHIEMMCEDCLLEMLQERIKKESLKCDECGEQVKVRIEDDIAWFFCEKGCEESLYGEYLLEPLDPEDDKGWF